MRIQRYLPIMIIALLLSCGGDDDANTQKGIIRVNIEDVKMYVGSSSGPKEYPITEGQRDSVIRRHFNGRYDVSLYSDLAIEFKDNRITYTYRDTANVRRKVLTNYYYESDSLFAIKSDGSNLFIALGTNENDIYRINASFRSISTPKDTTISKNERLDLSKVLGYASVYNNNMTLPTDTVVWLNAIYPFE